MKSFLRYAIGLLGLLLVSAAPTKPTTLSELPRLAIYFQTTHDAQGLPVSLLPLVTEKHIALTHLIVGALHVGASNTIRLNDHEPSDARFATLWNETRVLQAAGVKVLGMVGGGAGDSFDGHTLDAGDPAAARRLDGLDLDVECRMSQAGIARLVRRLRADFGRDFVVTLAPTARALAVRGDDAISGFDYAALERAEGRQIDFYNAQFYNGHGDPRTTEHYETIVEAGWSPRRIVMSLLTGPAHGERWFVPFDTLNRTVRALRAKYGEIGGIACWEYFNSYAGDGGQGRSRGGGPRS